MFWFQENILRNITFFLEMLILKSCYWTYSLRYLTVESLEQQKLETRVSTKINQTY